MNFTKVILITLLLVTTIAPLAVSAQTPLVPCGRSSDSNPNDNINETSSCTLCHLYVLIQRVINYLAFTIASLLAALAIGIGGFNILISGDNPGRRALGYKVIQTSIIGLVIMFAAWLIINEVLLFFVAGNNPNQSPAVIQNPWNEIQCSTTGN